MDSLCTTGLYFYFSKDIHASAVKEIIEYLSKIPDLKIHYPFDLKNYSINNRLAKDIEEKGLEKNHYCWRLSRDDQELIFKSNYKEWWQP
jgi:hypothetical protein